MSSLACAIRGSPDLVGGTARLLACWQCFPSSAGQQVNGDGRAGRWVSVGGYDLLPRFIGQGVPVRLAECKGFAISENCSGDTAAGSRRILIALAQDATGRKGLVLRGRADCEYIAVLEGDEGCLYWQQVFDRLRRRLKCDPQLVRYDVRFGGSLERRVDQHTAVSDASS